MSDATARVDALMEQWKSLAEAGTLPSIEELCDSNPELVSEVARRVAALQRPDPHIVETLIPGSEVRRQMVASAVAAQSPGELDVITRYRDLQFFNKGGLGEIFSAQEQALQRQVALKFIQDRHADNTDTCTRFITEAEVTARLDHPGVVPVFSLGYTKDNRPFYAMRLIRGMTLDQAIEEFHRDAKHSLDNQSVAFRNLLSRFNSICHTLAYAHNRGIIHRDVKPQNVMLGKYGETLVVDWGLAMPIGRTENARMTSGEETLTPETGSSRDSARGVVGTPSFMSPEQARGEDLLTIGTDIYALGATLYKLLTGTAPFHGATSLEVLEKVKRGDFPLPRKFKPQLSRSLEAICTRAMAVSPRNRYHTCTEVAEDIERWLADQPVNAYNEPWLERKARWMRQHKTVTIAVIATLLVVTMILGPVGVWISRDLAAHAEADLQARKDRLSEVATSSAATFAADIDLRWRMLSRDSESSELLADIPLATFHPAVAGDPKPLGAPVGNAAQQRLTKWIKDRRDYNNEFIKGDSWFIIDTSGLQLARYPDGITVGQRFRYRSYFHGKTRDVDPIEAEDLPINTELHRSTVFQSKSSGRLQITFSVPIWSTNDPKTRKILGRLGTTVELGQFTSLNNGLSKGQAAMLVDSREYEGGVTGKILQHPGWEETRLGKQSVESLRHFPHALVDEIKAHPDRLVLSIEDPIGGEYVGKWLAAFEPVLVSRGGDLVDTDLVVIVMTRDQ